MLHKGNKATEGDAWFVNGELHLTVLDVCGRHMTPMDTACDGKYVTMLETLGR